MTETARTLADDILKAAGAWSFDIDAVPRGRLETRTNAKGNPYQVFVMQTVWVANKDGKVYMTHWEPDDGKEPSVGRWAGWCKGDEPVAWMPFVKPVHPVFTQGDAA